MSSQKAYDRIRAFSAALFSQAHQAGLQQCQIYAVTGAELYADTSDHEVISEVTALSFDAAINGKTVSIYSENLSHEGIPFLVRACLENASILEPTATRSIFNGKVAYPSLNASHAQADDIQAIRSLSARMHAAIQTCGEVFALSSGYVQSFARTIYVINDAGLDVSTPHSQTFAVFDPIHQRDGITKTSQFFTCGSCPSDLNIEAQISEGTQYVKQYHQAEAINSGNYAAVFYNEAASHILQSMGIFFCKDFVDQGRSLFNGKLGQQVAAPCVTIVDDPYKANGLFSMPFDAQGVPTRQRTLIDQGRLNDLFCDIKTAMPENGLFPGSLMRSRVNLSAEISATNMSIQPGDSSLQTLLHAMGNGLFITEVSDYFPGHGLNLASGDFSLPCKGFIIQNGEITQPFDNVTAAGNLYLFLQQIEQVGNQQATGLPVNLIPGMPFRAGSYSSPALLIQSIAIAG